MLKHDDIGRECRSSALPGAPRNRVSHKSGETRRIMAEAQVTLQQVLLLARLHEASSSSASGLAATLRLSLSAVSQAVDRLVRMELVSRMEDGVDRRRKRIATTAKANAPLPAYREHEQRTTTPAFQGCLKKLKRV